MLLDSTQHLRVVEQLIGLYAKIFHVMGFKHVPTQISPPDSQVVYNHQVISSHSSLTLTVMELQHDFSATSRTFNLEFRALSAEYFDLKLQNRPIKQIIVQLIESVKFKQLSLLVYFKLPLNYHGEDLVFRVKMEKLPKPRLTLGFPWMQPQQHLTPQAALELSQQLYSLFPPTEV